MGLIRKLRVTQQTMERAILGVSLRDQIRNKEIRMMKMNSGSYPNLPSTINASQPSELFKVNVRNKRKFTAENEELKAEFSDVKHEFIGLRKQMTGLHLQMSEMMTYLTSNSTMQIDNFAKISEDVSVIKNQVSDIKSTTEFLNEELRKLKLEIMNIKSSTQKKIELLESKIQSIESKTFSEEASPKVKAQEEIIIELNERNVRSRNILVSGIAELTSTDPKERQIHDKNASWSILKTIYTDCPQPEKVYRIGKHNPDKNRLIKLEKRKRALILGDFNYDLLSTERSVRNYKTTVKESGYDIINKIHYDYCTRETDKSKTILDHACTNLKQNKFHFAIIESSMSDHKQIYLEIKNYRPEPLKTVKYQAIDYGTLYKTVESCTKDSNKKSEYSILEENIIKCINQSRISKIKKCNPVNKDWINKSIIEGIDRRNALWLKYRKNPTDNKIGQEFLTEKKNVAQIIQDSKTKYYCKSFKSCQNKPAKMWSLINTLCCNKSKEVTVPAKLKTENDFICDPVEICEYFNKFFSTIGETLANAIPATDHKANVFIGTKIVLSQLSHLLPTSIAEVSKIVDNLNCNTAAGIDGVNTKAIKCIKTLIISNLTNCINDCLERGIFPESLKLAKVTPIFKSGNKSDPGNYRPISVLPIISKIFEKIIYNRLEIFLNINNIISQNQYGFRKKSNTLSATIDLITKLKVNIDQKKIALGIFIDLKKAFDTVSHEILLEKLANLGITGSAYSMFKSYLSNRSQIVKIGDHRSKPKPVTFGVPQGSILGPLLFLIYINSINEIGLKGNITLTLKKYNTMYSTESALPYL
nr:uncharacterized protein LOC117982579 [Maniola hyperantus]